MSEYVTKQTFINHRAAVASFDLSTHGSIFLNREPEILASPQDGIAWTEGPVWTPHGNDWRLLFSDTVEGSLWAWNAVEGLKRLRHYAGGCSDGDEEGAQGPGRRALRLTKHEESLRTQFGASYCFRGQHEPGPNGMALDPRTGLMVLAQHGSRRVVRFDPASDFDEPVDVLAASYDGLPLNCPNDVAISAVDGSIVFTDPYYCFLEKDRLPLGDHNYTHERSALGFAGVYSVAAPSAVGRADLERPTLVANDIARPNGIYFDPDTNGVIWVSECCQGHSPQCPKAVARWHRYVPRSPGNGEPSHTRSKTIEWARPEGGGGCANGFVVLRQPPEDNGKGAMTYRAPLLVASCPLGVCVVDTGRTHQPVVEYVPFGKFRVSNIAFDGNGSMYATGEGHVWRLKLSPEIAVGNSTLTRSRAYDFETGAFRYL